MKKQRARSAEDKAYRKQSIVDALNQLLEQRQTLHSAGEVARLAGVTKGVIYSYFKTREEIFLTLFLQHSQQFLEQLVPAVGGPHYHVEQVRETFIEFASSHPVLMYLGLIAPSVLEHNVSPEFIAHFKQSGADGLSLLAEQWQRSEPEVPVESLRQFLLRMFMMGQVLWQHHHPPPAVSEAVAVKDNWLLQGSFEDSLRESFDWMWRGLKAEGRPKTRDLASG